MSNAIRIDYRLVNLSLIDVQKLETDLTVNVTVLSVKRHFDQPFTNRTSYFEGKLDT